jgi:hypothetical protein
MIEGSFLFIDFCKNANFHLKGGSPHACLRTTDATNHKKGAKKWRNLRQ